jgi:hypothetical protein
MHMNKALRVIASATATAAIGLGGSALPASAAVSSSTTSWNQASYQNRHNIRDHTRHDTQHGWFDQEDRWHEWGDGSGWRDDNGNWRADDDHNGSWTGHDGCRHDRYGWWDHNGHRHEYKVHHRTW